MSEKRIMDASKRGIITKCVVCGKRLSPSMIKGGRKTCSVRCSQIAGIARESSKRQTPVKYSIKEDKLEEFVEQEEEESGCIEMIKPRKCHDCGKPTFNYRCSACWEKWRAKYGVIPDVLDEDDFNGGQVKPAPKKYYY